MDLGGLIITDSPVRRVQASHILIRFLSGCSGRGFGFWKMGCAFMLLHSTSGLFFRPLGKYRQSKPAFTSQMRPCM